MPSCVTQLLSTCQDSKRIARMLQTLHSVSHHYKATSSSQGRTALN
jgi:hypothetical protein